MEKILRTIRLSAEVLRNNIPNYIGEDCMDIAMLTGLFPKNAKEEIIQNSIGVIQNAADALQWNLVEGLDTNMETPVKVINSLYIGSYPQRYKKAVIHTEAFQHAPGANDINVGFLNLPLIKHYARYVTLRPHLKAWATDGKEDKVIIAYAMTSPFTNALRYVKKLNPDITTCLVVPDLPEYMNTARKQSLAYSVLKKADRKMIDASLAYCDKFILLTEPMADSLGVDDYLVVEGVATEQEVFEQERASDIILYTGTLHEKYGILNLLDAFEEMKNQNYRLVICGSGDSENIIKQRAEKNGRIDFRGQLPREEILQLQRKAAVLVNPRQGTEEFTKYSFPSKNLEYLSTGRPVVAYKLAGIPAEYDGYFFYVEDESIESFASKLDEVCSLSPEEQCNFGQRAAEFVQKHKNKKAQGKRILDFVSN